MTCGSRSSRGICCAPGPDPMASGVTCTAIKAGERIYLGLPARPGAGTDHAQPGPRT